MISGAGLCIVGLLMMARLGKSEKICYLKCKNFKNELNKLSIVVHEWKNCLKHKVSGNQCGKQMLVANAGFQRISFNLSIKEFFEEITKRLMIHSYLIRTNRKYIKGLQCHKEGQIANISINMVRSWVRIMSYNLGFLSLNKPSKLVKVAAVKPGTKDQCAFQIQLLKHLSKDVYDMNGRFKSTGTQKCIIAAC